ncbi:prepilin-type N-terminal cleavage/methylation domain-containing protein [Microcoleus sp. FACHB-SPT15]|uniref:hormogonium polysaccharide secretion pseudopilin HpsC n=1 Tax=Microcoleus sp. FACHB-SPT15 TaxID=2692830 RepID=UPI001786F477|nr:hormogonium polysaccharide secretion pseudopilin HpsC [Microcoleus sp. FACHB-SPT15]MBD1806891.1 prepilin-type N-terminal cleavage/methylation domain-containing protein [Microcoleus sp. FACHB-SPT15]
MSAAKFILNILSKHPQRGKRAKGFTLIELLVAMILTALIITPLLGFAVSIMTTDRQEQAKVASQQEIQAALDYIAQDMQQAIYIYDAQGLSAGADGILEQIPPLAPTTGCNNASECTPVLAFWKRKYLDKDDVINGVRIGDIDNDNLPGEGSDRFVYALVVYYLIKDGQATWSPVARIGRFEIRGGITGTTTSLPPSDGFADFPQVINEWQKGTGAYTTAVETLIDYIDDTPAANFTATAPQFQPPGNNGPITATGAPTSIVCNQRIAANEPAAYKNASRVPTDDTSLAVTTGSFYACVNPINSQGQSVAQIFIRGNALPRINTSPNSWAVTAGNQTSQLANRPVASVLVSVRGLISGDE